MRVGLARTGVIGVTALAVFLPLGLIFYQSLLDAPFFMPNKLSFGAFQFIFADSDFWDSLENSLTIATAMVVIAVPLGGILAFLRVRTDLPGRSWIEPLLLIPVFVSPMVLGFGYVVSAGPVGFYSVWAKELVGGVPWNVYSLAGIAVIAGLTHVPHVYLYSSSALKSLGSDVEEAARMTGSSPFQVARDVSLPMVTPSLLFSGVLVFFLGFEIFGLALVLGDPEGHLVLATYLFKLTNKLGTPSYHLMAAVAVCIVAMTFPLVMLQRFLLRNAGKYITVKGKAGRQRPLPAGLALDGDVLAGVAQQEALQHHQRKRHGDDADRDRRHEVIGRRAELVGELEEIGREDEVAFRVAEHQRQAEDLEAEEEHEHAREEEGRRHHGQADVARDLERRRAGHAGGFFHVRAQALQRRRRIEVDVRYVRQAGDHGDAGERIDVPRHAADQLLRPHRIETDRAGRHDIAAVSYTHLRAH